MTLDLEHLRRVASEARSAALMEAADLMATEARWQLEMFSRGDKAARLVHQRVQMQERILRRWAESAADVEPTISAKVADLAAVAARWRRQSDALRESVPFMTMTSGALMDRREASTLRRCAVDLESALGVLPAPEGDGGPEGRRDDDNAGDGRRGAQEGAA